LSGLDCKGKSLKLTPIVPCAVFKCARKGFQFF
jgi:hypothetical protein